MTEQEKKIIIDSLLECSNLSITNALTYIQKGLEAYKEVEIPIVSADGQYCYGVRTPYRDDKAIQTFIDFMLVYLDEAIKDLEKKGKSE